ncbi:MAG: DUF1559 domain-containing protein [Gemmataceae bacterium]|nr:DUF1559 domain-containing protein [Gemmataceae bacterium]
MEGRRGKSLIEVLVAIGILSTLLALLLPAVMKVRAHAQAVAEQNNERQIVMAMHHYASDFSSRIPGRRVHPINSYDNTSPLVNILPYVGYPVPDSLPRGAYPVVKLYLSPTDPAVGGLPINTTYGPTCYAVNQQVFGGDPTLTASIPDGLSNTIALSQRYLVSYFVYGNTRGTLRTTYTYIEPVPYNDPSQIANANYHSGTFADPLYFDALPVITPNSTRSSLGGATFQTAPIPTDADSRLVQATQSSGLLVCMFDGSVRRYSPSVSEQVFWSAVTPDGAEVATE